MTESSSKITSAIANKLAVESVSNKNGDIQAAVVSQKEPNGNPNNSVTITKPPKKRGWDEIESLFQTGKEKKKEQLKLADKARKGRKERRKQREQENRVAVSSEIKDNSATSTYNNKEQWIDDGLGGKYNSEGYTGRTEDGVRIFKAHLLSKPGAGTTPQCPFDCSCCFI